MPSQGRVVAPPPLRSHPLRALVIGPPPGPDRIFYHNIWFKGHNNPRYAALLPRLRRLDLHLAICSDRRVPRHLQFRALVASRRLRNPTIMVLAGRRYRWLFTTDLAQIRSFRGSVLADVDDPRFTPAEVDLLGRDNVLAYVVTAEAAARRYQAMGLDKPHYVIPQGVSFASLEPGHAERVGAERRREGELVIGYVAAWLLSEGDRDGDNPLYNVDHLLELWQGIRSRLPFARLWLVGHASERVRRLCGGREDILLLGRLPGGEALAHVSCFDVALYPRRVDHAPFAVKIAEYLGLGIPTVAYDLELSQIVRENGAGLLASTPTEFVDAVCELGMDPARRVAMGVSASAVGRLFDWDELASRYEREILDTWMR